MKRHAKRLRRQFFPAVAPITYCIMVLLVIAARPPADRDSPAVLSVRSPDQTIYWCGHHLSGQVTADFRNSVLHLNGISEPVQDTTGTARRERNIASLVGHIPYIRDRVTHGATYFDAANAYGLAKAATIEGLARAYREAGSRGLLEQSVLVDLVDTTLVAVDKPLQVDSTGISITFRGEQPTHVPIDFSSASSIGPPPPSATTSPLPEAKRRLHDLVEIFRAPGRILVVANQNATLVLRGNDAERALREIDAIRQDPNRVLQAGAAHLIPRAMLREIASSFKNARPHGQEED